MSSAGASGSPRGRPGPHTRRPRFTRGRIAQAALEIADREGFAAVTMRRVAAELGAGTMTLYHYVRTKEDLVALMDDALMAAALVPEEELCGSWRVALTLIARRTRDLLVAHPWSLTSFQDSGFGPHALRHFEQSLSAIAGLELDRAARLELLALVDDYTFGNALHTAEALRRAAIARRDPAMLGRRIEEGLEQLRTGDFPNTVALFGGADPPAALDPSAGPPMDSESLERQFERGLEAVLDGAAARWRLG